MPARIAVVRNPQSGTALDTARRWSRRCATPASVADILDMPDEDRVSIDGSIALPPSHDVIAAAGGDGTVSAVAAGVARASKTLAVIPTGTLNHFARDAGISTELE